MRAGQNQPCVTLRAAGHGGDAKMGMELKTGQQQYFVALLGIKAGGGDNRKHWIRTMLHRPAKTEFETAL